MNDALSILIPTHNRADLLKQTLRSLHGLNIPEGVSVELIVVANGCTDDTPRVVADDSSHLPVTTRFVEEPRLGVSNARNRAIQEAHFDLLAFLDDAAFRVAFSKSPIKRTGRDRFVRNVLIAIGNSGEASLWGSARVCLDDPSPLVRAMAVWALSRLLDADAFAQLRAERLEGEADPDVRAEWQPVP